MPLAFFDGPLGRWLIIGLVGLALFGFGWVKGSDHEGKKLVKYIGEQAEAAVRIVTKRGEVTQKVVNKYIKVEGKTQVITETIEREVIKYADANTGACLTPDWRVLHDRAADNALPGSGRATDAAGGAPGAAEALQTVTGNYAACHRTADRLDALQTWINEQRRVK